MNEEEIIGKIMSNQWWPFDRVDPKILEEVMRRQKKQERAQMEDAPL
jgi:hypothetical protein